MKTVCGAVLLLAVMASASEVTPVQKVVELLNGMLEKGKSEKHAEQVQFAAYKQFCEDTSADKQRAIELATTHKDYTESVDALGRAIQVLKTQQSDLGAVAGQ